MARVVNKPILLKDGSSLGAPHKDRIGTIVRYSKGSSALMRILRIEDDTHGTRLYGMNIIGEEQGAYAHNCVVASGADLGVWESYTGVRGYSYLQNSELKQGEGRTHE